ncbi:MAG: hypothetical protein Q8908_10050 [Bacteroidota bacterium]|nr:hypothetical protein [Bacteroidota bacterium]
MKKVALIFTTLAFIAGVAVISCTKDSSTQTPTAITTAAEAVQADNSVSDISNTIDSYEAVNPTTFADPTLKAANANGPTAAGIGLDNCATVTITKTPVLTGTAVTGATVVFTIDFGTTGTCKGKDGKVRTGKITSTYNWVKEGGWSRSSSIDLTVDSVHHVGTLNETFGKTGTNNHALYTESANLTITGKDGTSRTWTSDRQRELVEGNGGVAAIKIWKITGSSTYTNAKGEKSTYTITNPLYQTSNCKGFVAGTVVTVSTAGVSTTIDYGTYTTPAAAEACKDGYTVKAPGDKNGKGIVTRFIKFGK